MRLSQRGLPGFLHCQKHHKNQLCHSTASFAITMSQAVPQQSVTVTVVTSPSRSYRPAIMPCTTVVPPCRDVTSPSRSYGRTALSPEHYCAPPASLDTKNSRYFRAPSITARSTRTSFKKNHSALAQIQSPARLAITIVLSCSHVAQETSACSTPFLAACPWPTAGNRPPPTASEIARS